jgi:hypothetical protein
MNDDNSALPVAAPVPLAATGGETSHTHFKLPTFWAENPALWFTQVECILANRNVTRQFNRYCLVVEALPHESLRLVADLVEAVPAEDLYTVLKARLLSVHPLTDFQPLLLCQLELWFPCCRTHRPWTTDHKPLTFALHRTLEQWSARQQHQLS